MKKVDSNNGVWVNDDPATLTNGTPIDADVMNNIQDEISNVITDNGGTLDGTNHSQLSQTLNKNFAKLNSPTLTGIPLTSNPDGTINNQIATVDYVNQKAMQATVGFTPVQQSGGKDQGANKIYIGADKTDSNQVRVQVDQTDRGLMVFQDNDAYTHGVDQIGFNIGGQTFAFRDRIENQWRFSYTTDQIDAKAYISSLPDGNNLKVSNLIWNSSSSSPALYYGTNNNVEYLATTDWTEGRYIRSPANPAVDYRIQTISRNRASGGIFVAAEDGSNTPLQPAGDYATNTALSSEADARHAADQALDANKVNRSGDFNITGPMIANTGTGCDTAYTANGYYIDPASGIKYSSAFRTGLSDSSRTQLRYEYSPGNWARTAVYAQDDGSTQILYIYTDGKITTGDGRTVAFTADLPSSGTTGSGYWTQTAGVLTQNFVVNNVVHQDSGTWVNFPRSFSSDSGIVVHTTSASNNDMDTFAFNANRSGFYINIPYDSGANNLPVFVTATGRA